MTRFLKFPVLIIQDLSLPKKKNEYNPQGYVIIFWREFVGALIWRKGGGNFLKSLV